MFIFPHKRDLTMILKKILVITKEIFNRINGRYFYFDGTYTRIVVKVIATKTFCLVVQRYAGDAFIYSPQIMFLVKVDDKYLLWDRQDYWHPISDLNLDSLVEK